MVKAYDSPSSRLNKYHHTAASKNKFTLILVPRDDFIPNSFNINYNSPIWYNED